MASHGVIQTPLSSYLKEVHDGMIRIPEFQRNFVWNKSQMVKLAASLMKGYPIGSFLLMENAGDYANRAVEGASVKPEDPQKCLLVLDGQQRTTTSYQLFYGKGDYLFYFKYKEFIKDISNGNNIEDDVEKKVEDLIEDWVIVFDQASKKNPETEADQLVQGLFPFSLILNGSYTKWLAKYNRNYSKDSDAEFEKLTSISSLFTNTLINNIITYQTSQIIINGDTSPNVVCTIFETINSTGIKLTIIDLLNAKCFPHSFFLNDEIEKAFDDSKYTFFKQFDAEIIGLTLIKVIGLMVKKSCKKTDLLRLEASEIKNNFNESLHFLEKTLIFIKSQFGVLGKRFLPYADMLPPIAMIINSEKFNSNDPKHLEKISQWYWHCVFDGHFDNATESKSASAVIEFVGDGNAMLGWIDDDNIVPPIIRNKDLKNSDFKEIHDIYTTGGAKYKAIFNLIILNAAPDFSISKTPINELQEDDLEDHHIFPKKFLGQNKIKGKEANSILNRTLISKKANGEIKDNPPAIYFQNQSLFGHSLLDENDLKKHFINIHYTNDTYSKGLFNLHNYNEFKEERHKFIVNMIKSKLA